MSEIKERRTERRDDKKEVPEEVDVDDVHKGKSSRPLNLSVGGLVEFVFQYLPFSVGAFIRVFIPCMVIFWFYMGVYHFIIPTWTLDTATGTFHTGVAVVLVVLILWSFARAALSNPGVVTSEWARWDGALSTRPPLPQYARFSDRFLATVYQSAADSAQASRVTVMDHSQHDYSDVMDQMASGGGLMMLVDAAQADAMPMFKEVQWQNLTFEDMGETSVPVAGPVAPAPAPGQFVQQPVPPPGLSTSGGMGAFGPMPPLMKDVNWDQVQWPTPRPRAGGAAGGAVSPNPSPGTQYGYDVENPPRPAPPPALSAPAVSSAAMPTVSSAAAAAFPPTQPLPNYPSHSQESVAALLPSFPAPIAPAPSLAASPAPPLSSSDLARPFDTTAAAAALDPYKVSYCSICCAFKPPRAHHCSTCGRCVFRMDHHCLWLNTCVGIGNYKPFLLTLIYGTLGLVYFLVLCLVRAFSQGFPPLALSGNTMLWFAGVATALYAIKVTSGLVLYHVTLATKNLSQIEYMFQPMSTHDQFSQGSRVKNLEALFGPMSVGWFLPIDHRIPLS